MPSPTSANLLVPGIEPISPVSPALADRFFFTTEPPGMPQVRNPRTKKKKKRKSAEHLRSMGGYAHQLGLCPAGHGVPGSPPHTATVISLLFPEHPASPYLWTVASAAPSSWCLSPGVPMVVRSSSGDLPHHLARSPEPSTPTLTLL